MTKEILTALGIVGLMAGAAGCASKAGNVALGAGAAGAAYEYSNKKEVDKLDQELKEGKITQAEHDRRVEDIKKHSLVE